MKPINVKGKGRHYRSPETRNLLPSVTNILGCYPKQRVLVPWAANQQKELDVEAAFEVYQARKEFRDAEHFRQVLDEHIGKRRKHKTELAKAGDIGTVVHEAIACDLKRELGLTIEDNPTLDGPALNSYISFQKWWAECEVEPIEVETFVFSDEMGIAGTTDLVAKVGLNSALFAHLSPIQADLRKIVKLGQTVTMDVDFKTGKGIYQDQWLQLAAYMACLQSMAILDDDSWGMIVRLPKVADDPGFEIGLLPPWDRQRKLEAFLAVKTIWEDIHNG